jgi:hypothetical protein
MKGAGKGEDRSKIICIAHWLSQMLMWHSGEGDRCLVLKKKNRKYGTRAK